jgi:predicted Ser/Thr protein kinase
MVKLADLVHIANNAKTDAQKNAVGEELKKYLRGKKACNPKELFSNKGLKIEKGKNLRKLGEGQYGAVFYGCLDDLCRTEIAVKVTSEPSARMEYRIAEKLKGMGVPRMYHFKSCNNEDVLYFEYIEGEALSNWLKKYQSSDDYRVLISRLIGNLKKIHQKYPKFRHHDLHWNNILVLKDNKPIIIDFGMAMIEGIRNPIVTEGDFKNAGIYSGSHYMYDAHYILNIIHSFTKNRLVRKFIEDLFPKKYLKNKSDVVLDGRLRPVKHEGLPTYDDILKHPFLQLKKKLPLIPKRTVKPKPMQVKPKTPPAPKSKKGETAFDRAKRILAAEAEKKKQPLKRPGIVAKRSPTVKEQVRSIERKIAAEKKPKTPQMIKNLRKLNEGTPLPPNPMKKLPTPKRPKVFVNKNGDLKIDRRKCRLYKKEELVKMFKLDPKLTKEQMCKFIKNM